MIFSLFCRNWLSFFFRVSIKSFIFFYKNFLLKLIVKFSLSSFITCVWVCVCTFTDTFYSQSLIRILGSLILILTLLFFDLSTRLCILVSSLDLPFYFQSWSFFSLFFLLYSFLILYNSYLRSRVIYRLFVGSSPLSLFLTFIGFMFLFCLPSKVLTSFF